MQNCAQTKLSVKCQFTCEVLTWICSTIFRLRGASKLWNPLWRDFSLADTKKMKTIHHLNWKNPNNTRKGNWSNCPKQLAKSFCHGGIMWTLLFYTTLSLCLWLLTHACFESLDQYLGDCPNIVALLTLLKLIKYSSCVRYGCLHGDDGVFFFDGQIVGFDFSSCDTEGYHFLFQEFL